MEHEDHDERERERFIFRQLGPGVGIWRLPQVQHVAPSTGRLPYRPAAFLSMVQSILYIGLFWPSKSLCKSVVQMMCPCFTPMRHPLPLLQPYQNFYNAGETALSREPTLQRLLLLRGCLLPPLGPVAFVAFCTTGAVCAFLRAQQDHDDSHRDLVRRAEKSRDYRFSYLLIIRKLCLIS